MKEDKTQHNSPYNAPHKQKSGEHRRETGCYALASFNDNGIITFDKKKIANANWIAVEYLHAHTPDDIIGKDLTSIVPPECRDVLTDETSNTKRWGKLIRCDGSHLEVEMMVVRPPQKTCHSRHLVFRTITEERSSEKILINASNEWRTTFDTMPNAVCLLDEEGMVVRCNKRMTEISEKTYTEIIGSSCAEIMDCTFEDSKICPLKRVHKSHQRESLVLQKNDRWMHISMEPLPGQAGSLRGAVLVISDITAHKRAEDRLLHLNKLFLNLTPSYRKNINMFTQACKQQLNADRIIYRKKEESTLRAISQWQDSRCNHDIESAEKKLCCEIIQRARKGESVHVVKEYTEPSADPDNPHITHTFVGHPVFRHDECIGSLCISFSKHVVLAENDELLISIISTAIGIEEERNEVEQQILAQKTFLNHILESLSHPLYVIDIEDYKLKMWNAAADISNSEEHPACYETIHKQKSPCSENGIHCPMEMVKRTKKAQTLEHVHYDRDGNPRTFEVHGHPVFDDNGNLIQVIQYAFDITDRNRLLEELQKTQKLESLGILAGGIAHDFNNIITAILGNIEILKVYLEAHKHSERLLKIENAVFRARDLIQQLLTFSKGGAPIKKILSIIELLKESAGFVLRGSNVKCEFSIQDDLWAVEIDEGQISQVINNLLLNADQAMRDGGTINITAKNHIIYNVNGLPLHKGKYVRISIEDHGVGIPEENISKIFDPYFTTKEKGNGLGLTTAYSIIRKHDGYITVDSKVGRGSTFSIYLPASDETQQPEQMVEKHIIKGTGKILVVDDEETVRDVAQQMLNLCGYEAECVSDGAEALELYRKALAAGSPYDIVIMDLTIPGGLGGKETIKKLLNIDPQAKAVASSGYSSAPVMSEFKKYGFRGVLTKPYRMQELSELLHRILKND